MKPILSEAEKNRIAETVTRAEESTSAEIVTAIVRRSDDYPEARWSLGVCLALLFGLGLWFFDPGTSALHALWIEVPGLLLGLWLGSGTLATRALVSRSRLDSESRQRAIELFHSRGVTGARGGALLIFISLLEKKVELLADPVIAEKIPQTSWDELAREIATQVGSGSRADALCLGASRAGSLLAKALPSGSSGRTSFSNTPLET